MKYYPTKKVNALEKIYSDLEDIVDERFEAFDETWFTKENSAFATSQEGWETYQKKRLELGGKEWEIMKKTELDIRMNKKPVLRESSNIGDIMTLKEFIVNVECGGFINYDGFGTYMKDGKESDIHINPSDVKTGNLRKDFDTIMWYNR